MFYIGTAGVPIQCNERGSEGGIKCVSKLNLDAMEIQFVRGVRMNQETAKNAGKVAKDLNVKLSVHAPYFINLASRDKEKIKASKERILNSARIGNLLGARVVVFHPGFYTGRSQEKAYTLMKESINEIRDILDHENNRILLGPETMGRQKQFGTVDELVKLCSEIEGTLPVIDFAHVHARGNGCLKKQEDFARVLNKVEDKLGEVHHHMHITGIFYVNGNEKHHITIDNKEPDFSLLARELLERDTNATIISESPNIETDALKLKKMLS